MGRLNNGRSSLIPSAFPILFLLSTRFSRLHVKSLMLIKLRLFGTPQLETETGNAPFRRRKGLALLAYLAVTQRPQSRETLLGLLWPEFSQESARNNFRRELSLIKKQLPNNTLQADMTQVSLTSENGLWVDVLAFQSAFEAHSKTAISDAAQAAALAEAVSHCIDPFLAGFKLSNCLAFEEWQESQAENLRQQLSSAYQVLIDWHAQQQEFNEAIRYGRLWLTLDSLHEPAHRRLMTLYAKAGQQAAALRQYQACVNLLEAELGVPPELATEELHESIKAQEIEIEQTAVSPPPPPAPVHLLPTPTTPLVGRHQEIQTCFDLLSSAADCRLLTLIGPGGIGKTRLALEVGHRIKEQFADGVVFIQLADIDSPDLLAKTIGAQLEIAFHGRTAVSEQLITYLAQKQRLLLLDNFEHLVGDEVMWLSDLLRQAPKVKLLLTSRERLNLEGEWTLPLEGLSHHANKKSEAVDLFIQRAQQTLASFSPTDSERSTIQAICELLEGWPLGIILAASWVKLLSCQEIYDEISESIDFLTTQARNVPERHRSMRAVLRQTWQRLSAVEQDALKKLAVFRGGFLRDAAKKVTNATLSTLSSLVDKSLLTFERENGRYRLHEFLRQYAAEKLANSPEGQEQTVRAHADYYNHLVANYDHYLIDMTQGIGIQHLEADIDNIRLAWQTAVKHKDFAALENGVYPLGHFFYERRWYQEATARFQNAINVVETSQPLNQQLLAKLQIMVGCQNLPQGHLTEGISLIRKGLKQAYHFEDEPFMELGERWLGWGFYLQSKPDRAERHLKKSLEICLATDNIQEASSPLNILGLVSLSQQRFADAKNYHLEALQHGTIHNGTILNNLAQLNVITGDYKAAEKYALEGLHFEVQHNRRHSLPYLYANLARAKFALGDLQAARANYDKDLMLSKEAGDIRGIAGTFDLLSRIALVEGEFNEAETYLTKALSMNKPMAQKFGIASNHVNLGLLACEINDLSKAEELLRTGLSHWKAQNNIRGQARALSLLAKVATKKGHFEEAKTCLAQADALVDPNKLLATWLWVKAHRAIFLMRAGHTEESQKLTAEIETNSATHFETRHYLDQES
ncbi:MAG: BTAD domain-containing putative transcriptional regulator [Chloroflexota bacterium]